jgi:hypothetical protein
MKILCRVAVFAAIFTFLPHIAWSQSAKDQSLPGSGDAPKSYQIANKKHGDLLRPKDANNKDGTPIVLYSAQPWKCLTWKLSPAEKSTFTVQNHFTGKTFTLESKDKENRVIQVVIPKDAAKDIKWRFVKLDDGNYRITDPKSGNDLTAVKGDKDEIRIALQPWEKKDEQKWELRQIDPAKLTM